MSLGEVDSKHVGARPIPNLGKVGSARRQPLSIEVVELTATRLRVIADPTRIALLEALNDGDAAVCDLADRIGLPHQTASRHLLALHQAGILSRRREGSLVRYAVTDWSPWWVIEQIARSAEPNATVPRLADTYSGSTHIHTYPGTEYVCRPGDSLAVHLPHHKNTP